MKYSFISILKEILDFNPNIKKLYFNQFPSNMIIQKQNDYNSSEKSQLEKALMIRKEYGFSFWESLISTFQNNSSPNFKLLDDVLLHNKNNNLFSYFSNELENLEKHLKDRQSNNVAFLSTVLTDNDKCQIPLIDFHIKPNKTNQDSVEFVLNKLELNSGFLINSGESYHFISKELVTQEELEIILAKLIFFTPIVDRNWVAHQLIEKKCALRITKGDKKDLEIVKRY